MGDTAFPERERMEVHVQVECATKALNDRRRPGATIAVARCPGPLPVEALQCTRVDREHRAAEGVILGKSMAKLEGKAQHPLPNRGVWEHVVDGVGCTYNREIASLAAAE